MRCMHACVCVSIDWKDHTHDILKPLHLTLQVQKSIFPNDSRLPGSAPPLYYAFRLTIAYSVKVNCSFHGGIEVAMTTEKIKDLLCLVQTFPLPQTSLPKEDPHVRN